MEIEQTKTCTKCGEKKTADEFHKDKTGKNGLSARCKICAIKHVKAYAIANRDIVLKKHREYYKKNKERIRGQHKEYYEKNKEKLFKKAKEWAAKNPEKKRAIRKKWSDKNPDYKKEYLDSGYRDIINARRNEARNKNPRVSINHRVGCGVRKSIKSGKNGRHWELLVGYTIDSLKKHLEKRFQPGMNWENYGSSWHIDHIIPISAFNFETPEHADFKRCWALKNLRPLWAEENLKKNNKLDRYFQPSLAL